MQVVGQDQAAEHQSRISSRYQLLAGALCTLVAAFAIGDLVFVQVTPTANVLNLAERLAAGGNIERLQRIADAAPASPLAKVITAGLQTRAEAAAKGSPADAMRAVQSAGKARRVGATWLASVLTLSAVLAFIKWRRPRLSLFGLSLLVLGAGLTGASLYVSAGVEGELDGAIETLVRLMSSAANARPDLIGARASCPSPRQSDTRSRCCYLSAIEQKYPAPAGVEALGGFVAAEGDGDHSYGYGVKLVRVGRTCYGLCLIYDGDLEPASAPFVADDCDPKTRLSFRVERAYRTAFEDPGPKKIDLAFVGKLEGSVLAGEFTGGETKPVAVRMPKQWDSEWTDTPRAPCVFESGYVDHAGQPAFVGVGTAEARSSYVMAEVTADNRARAEVAKIFETFAASLVSRYMRDHATRTLSFHIAAYIMTFSALTLTNAKVVEHRSRTGVIQSKVAVTIPEFAAVIDRQIERCKTQSDYPDAACDPDLLAFARSQAGAVWAELGEERRAHNVCDAEHEAEALSEPIPNSGWAHASDPAPWYNKTPPPPPHLEWLELDDTMRTIAADVLPRIRDKEVLRGIGWDNETGFRFDAYAVDAAFTSAARSTGACYTTWCPLDERESWGLELPPLPCDAANLDFVASCLGRPWDHKLDRQLSLEAVLSHDGVVDPKATEVRIVIDYKIRLVTAGPIETVYKGRASMRARVVPDAGTR